MDAQELRNLQEAYREVYTSPEELDEASRADEFTRAAIARNSGRKGGITFEPGPNWDPSANRGKGAHLSPKQKEKQRRKSLRQENVDLYDIILSHLLDEGYAETEEAAHKIMVNMSEEWKESIVEAEKSEEPDPFGRPGGKYGGVRKGGGYDRGYEAMKKKIKELEDKK